jgi:hypothetical protein
MKKNNNLTKRNIINKLRINKIKDYIKDTTITKKKLNYVLKENLLTLLNIQELIDTNNNFFINLPLDIQKKIMEYL